MEARRSPASGPPNARNFKEREETGGKSSLKVFIELKVISLRQFLDLEANSVANAGNLFERIQIIGDGYQINRVIRCDIRSP